MRYLFGDHLLDTARRELSCGGEQVAVEPQVFDLLVYLLQNRERVVSKDDLLGSVWGGRIVSDATLGSRITSARRAISDSGAEQTLIRTFARKGVRFIGEVQEEGTPAALQPEMAEEPERPELTRPEGPSIAVLPFANLSGDPEQEYFADGMVEEIITALSRIRWLFVIAPQFELHLQRPGGRCEARRARARRALCARRLSAQIRRPSADRRAVDRGGNRRAYLGRPL